MKIVSVKNTETEKSEHDLASNLRADLNLSISTVTRQDVKETEALLPTTDNKKNFLNSEISKSDRVNEEPHPNLLNTYTEFS